MKRKKKKLSELRAWMAVKRELLLGTPGLRVGSRLLLGLCTMVEDLEMEDAISSKMADRMYSIIQQVRPRRGTPRHQHWLRTGFLWDLGPEGIAKRVAFCNKQIKRCTQ